MLYKSEWNTPHDHPAGGTVAEWVETVRQLEEAGWLRDPKDDPVAEARRGIVHAQNHICLSLCWRRRCHRAGRCKHRLPLAAREFMPELSVVLSEITHEAPHYRGPCDPAKMQVLRDILGPPYPREAEVAPAR